jgi:hypothetical protein
MLAGFGKERVLLSDRNIFNDNNFLLSQVTEIHKPADVKTVHSECGVTGIRYPSTSSGQETFEVPKNISPLPALPDGSQHRLTSRKTHSTESEILTASHFKNDLDTKRGRKTKKQEYSPTNIQPINKKVIRRKTL